MTKLVNLTSHTIRIYGDGEYTTVPPSGSVARVTVYDEYLTTKFGHIPIYNPRFSNIVGLPDPKEGVAYIVSSMVLAALKDNDQVRGDVFAPGELIRDEEGYPVACTGLRL